MTKKTTPNVGIEQLSKEIELSNLKLKLPKQTPLPEKIDDLPNFVATESKHLMAAAKGLKKQLDELKKTLSKEYKVEYPLRYEFVVVSEQRLPRIKWHRVIARKGWYPELETKEVSNGVLRRFSNTMDWEIPLYLHLLDELDHLENRVKPIKNLSSQVRKTMRAIEKLHI
ncbi:hypothetical protein [Photobacterium atrarenae]|uniref:Uncharacterized protein n=1 Tax=Photobacterium atrarenae TaxID=865757 RepID=A0ABY5GR14_9GAMM|nr:hypothetical protein [Photobacterium atrarenae]UTV30972.1 hypothetical protein NNL38_24490 [Photobacterium atrarenae]